MSEDRFRREGTYLEGAMAAKRLVASAGQEQAGVPAQVGVTADRPGENDMEGGSILFISTSGRMMP